MLNSRAVDFLTFVATRQNDRRSPPLPIGVRLASGCSRRLVRLFKRTRDFDLLLLLNISSSLASGDGQF